MMKQNRWFYDENFLMSLEAESKEEAIRVLGNLLYKNGYVKDSFVSAVIAREREFATGLSVEGYGVAIPHTDTHHVIKQTVGVAILKEPIKFCVMGDPCSSEVDVKLILMLAVPDKNNVLTMITQIVEMIQDPHVIKTICQSEHRSEIITMLDEKLNVPCLESGDQTEQELEQEVEQELPVDTHHEITEIINHPVGLHARPASLFVKVAKKYNAEILVSCNEKQVNAKSILSVLSLGANKGSKIVIKAQGSDAQDALAELKDLVNSNFYGVD